MNQSKTKILIIEDVQGQYERIKNRLNDVLTTYVEVFPKLINKEENAENYFHLLNLAREEKFGEIFKAYPEIDIFIVDNSLSGVDHTGCAFLTQLRKENYRQGNYFIYTVSSTEKIYLPISKWDDKKEKYISKIGAEIYIEEIMLDEVMTRLKLKKEDLIKEDPAIKNKIYTSSYKAYQQFNIYRGSDRKMRIFLDRVITLSFYLLMLTTALTAAVNITVSFAHNTIHNVKQHLNSNIKKDSLGTSQYIKGGIEAPQNVNDGAKLDREEDDDLEKVEHIYIYILPFFIIFGFYNYYNGNKRISLLEGNEGTINEERSTKTMRMTKILFISSMISYIVIKVIQTIFSAEPSLMRLVSSGVLILILMGYFIFLEWHDMPGHGEESHKHKRG